MSTERAAHRGHGAAGQSCAHRCRAGPRRRQDSFGVHRSDVASGRAPGLVHRTRHVDCRYTPHRQSSGPRSRLEADPDRDRSTAVVRATWPPGSGADSQPVTALWKPPSTTLSHSVDAHNRFTPTWSSPRSYDDAFFDYVYRSERVPDDWSACQGLAAPSDSSDPLVLQAMFAFVQCAAPAQRLRLCAARMCPSTGCPDQAGTYPTSIHSGRPISSSPPPRSAGPRSTVYAGRSMTTSSVGGT